MLNAFYATLFKPGDPRFSQAATIGPLIGLLVLVILTLNAAGRFHLGATGLVILMVLFLVAGCLGLFWVTVALTTLTNQLFGGRGNGLATAQAITQGLWPLLFSGSAIAATRIAPILSAVLSLVISLGTFVTVAGSVRQVQHLTWVETAVCLLLTLVATVLALLGLFIWPLMLLAGT